MFSFLEILKPKLSTNMSFYIMCPPDFSLYLKWLSQDFQFWAGNQYPQIKWKKTTKELSQERFF